MRPRSLLPIACVLCSGVLGYYVFQPTEPPTSSADDAAPTRVVVLDEFGIEQSAFRAEDRKIKRNETFTDLLRPFNVSYGTLAEIAKVSRPTFDVRRIRAGKTYRIYHADDSLRTARYLVYESDRVHFVVFDLRDAVRVVTGERPVVVTEKEVGGIITSSLYNSLVDLEVNPALAVELSEVFAWQIDFYRIRKGDAFKVIFEERSVDGEPIGLGRILAARFRHMEHDYDAFLFSENKKTGYFDDEGNNVRKAFLMAPVKFGRISSRYSNRRFHPVQKRFKAHLGTDYAAATGTPIRATGDGVVVEARYRKYNGNYVKIRHNGTYSTGYLHMSKIAKGIRPGASVQQGQLIGYVGSTGLATGPHVCYRFWKNGRQVNHLREKFPSGDPVAATSRTAFFTLRDAYLDRLTFAPVPRGATVYATAAP